MPDQPGAEVTDAGRRLSDAVNIALLAQGPAVAGKWVAARLIDGQSDGVVYDDKASAVRHQLHEQLCCYVMITPDGMTPRDATRYIDINRQLYDAGMRLSDPAQHASISMTPEQHSGLILPSRRGTR